MIIQLDDVANTLNLKKKDFFPVVWDAGVYNGHRYGIPLDIHPLGFYYNKGVMEKAGLDPNEPPQTKDDYMAALEQMKSKGIQGHWMSPLLFTGGSRLMLCSTSSAACCTARTGPTLPSTPRRAWTH